MNAQAAPVLFSLRMTLLSLAVLGGVALAGTSKGIRLFKAGQYA